MPNFGAEIFERLLITIGVMIPVAVWILAVVHWMIDAVIEPILGLVAIVVALALAALVIWGPIPALQGPIIIAILTTIAVAPFANSQLAKFDFQEVVEDEFARAHAAYITNPDNAAARFEIARMLFEYGLKGHAISIAEQAANSIPNEKDPVSNQSLRDLFGNEIRRLQSWKRDTTSPKEFEPLSCPRCKCKNPLTAIACIKCGGPYLLDLARQKTVLSKLIAKLVVAWIVVAIVLTIVPLVAWNMGSNTATALIIGLLVATGFVLTYLFKDRTIGR